MPGKSRNTANAVQATGTIIKKCDLGRHNPVGNKSCAARDRGDAKGRCQHTCLPSELERCAHAWTVVYSVNSRQREESFHDDLNKANGRPVRGSGLRKAQAFQLELSNAKRAAGKLVVDPKAGEQPFLPLAEKHIAGLRTARTGTKVTYARNFRHAHPVLAGKSVAEVAGMRDDVDELVNVTLAGHSRVLRNQVLRFITGTLDSAVSQDVIGRHRLGDLKIAKPEVTEDEHVAKRAEFRWLTDAQVRTLAEGGAFGPMPGGKRNRTLSGVGIVAWLQFYLGLRIGEALGVRREEFVTREDGSRWLELRWQAADDGHARVPLKHKEPGKGRDIPVPDALWEMVEELPKGPLCPGPNSTYAKFYTVRDKYKTLADAMGITGFRSHWLRHMFASRLVERDVRDIAFISEILGHESVETTLETYVHAAPGAAGRVLAAMNGTPAAPGADGDPADELAALRAQIAELRARLELASAA
jgi:integrase